MTTETDNPVRSDREIMISRVFDAPRELVFKAWTDPEQVVRWWGPNGFTTTIHEMDLTPGGAWDLVMHGPDGTDYRNRSIFLEIVPPERIVFSHITGPKFRMTATFVALDAGKTELTVLMLFESAADLDRAATEFGAVEGLRQTLRRLGEHVATM